jgi:hypothetical protein
MHSALRETAMDENRNRDPNAPQNPPQSVVNKDVRRTALRTYFLPLIVFFAVVGVALLYWATQPPQVEVGRANDPDRDIPRAEGTAGNTTPGGHEPQRTPDSTRGEIEQRSGNVVTELGELLDERARGEVGRRVEVPDVEVERVESPTSFWVKDGNARVQIVIAKGGPDVRAGQHVNITGVAERSGETLRIRASRVTVNQ